MRNQKYFFLVFLLLLISIGHNPIEIEANVYLYQENNTVIGSIQTYKTEGQNESLVEIARDFNLGYNEIVLANPDVDPLISEPGKILAIPTMWILPDIPKDKLRNIIVVNLSELRLYYFYKLGKNILIGTFPIGIGEDKKNTPLGVFKIIEKLTKPYWYPPNEIRKERKLPARIPPGADNPLGEYALRLSISSYLIHGTNRPFSIGRRFSNGCIRLYPEDIFTLFKDIPLKTKVLIVNQPVKLGVKNKEIYIEIHAENNKNDSLYFDNTIKLLKKMNLFKEVSITELKRAIEEKTGIPTEITF